MKKNKLWLPSVFSDNMMLQEGKENLIWGKAGSESKITVTLAGKIIKGKADKKGVFKVNLPELSYGGPYTMTVQSAEKKHVIKNLLVGDVWVCSGQSNMAMIVKDCNNSIKEIKAARYPKMRIFSVPHMYALKPFLDVKGKWEEVTPFTVGKFSAAGYYFGRELHKNLHKPIGLIDTSYGGTKIEWWMSEDAVKNFKGYAKLKRNNLEVIKRAKILKKLRRTPKDLHKDTGNEGLKLGMEKKDYDFRKWKTINAPGYWNEKGLNFVGAVWLKKEVKIPKTWIKSDLALDLGPIVDFDNTYFNGEKIGSAGDDIPGFWNYNRKYLVPSRLLTAGRNNITIRIFAANRVGGFGAAKGTMRLSVINHSELGSISLEGKWRYRVERKLPALVGIGEEYFDDRTSGTLYNAMVSPLVGFGIKGFIWYQGESNADKPKEYFELKKHFINDLRKKWQDIQLPFYFVQLANFSLVKDDWAALRKAQQDTLKLPNTGMAVAIDIGESEDVHPKNKQDVGKRLAFNALAKTYGKNVEYSGPVYKYMKIQGKKLRFYFEHSESGLKAGSKPLSGFEIKGKNGDFVSAKAKIDKRTVIVWNESIKTPLAVRYGWANDPKCNLYNKAGLPAVPFKTKEF